MNMSYCRFHNTLQDLRDCYNNMEAESLEEQTARFRLIDLCCDIALAYGDEVDRELIENGTELNGYISKNLFEPLKGE